MKIRAITPVNINFPSIKPQICSKRAENGYAVLPETPKNYAFYGKDLIAGKNVSFGQYKQVSHAKEHPEFQTVKRQIEAKLKTLPENAAKRIDTSRLNETNICVAAKILSDERLYGNKGFMQKAAKIIRTSVNDEFAKGRILILDKFLTDERVNSNTGFQKHLRDIVFATHSEESAKAKSAMLDRIFSADKLLNDKNFMKNAPGIVERTCGKDEADAKISLVDKVLSAEKPFGEKPFTVYLPEIINSTNSSDIANRKIKILDKIISDEKLSKDGHYLELTGKLLGCTYNEAQMQVAEKFLSEERVYNDEYFTAENALYYTEHATGENAEGIINTVDFMLSDKRFNERKNFGMTLSNILVLNITLENPDIRSLTNNILKNDKLCGNDNFMYNLGNVVVKTAYSNIRGTAEKLFASPEKALKTVDGQYSKMLENPELYVNGEYEDGESARKPVKIFFEENYYNLLLTSHVFDEETVNCILRKRFEDAQEYMRILAEETPQENIDILEGLKTSAKENGKPLTPAEKVDFLYVLKAFDNLKADKTPVTETIKENRVDIYKINSILYEKLLQKCGLTEKEANETTQNESVSFDKRYVHLLSEEVRKADSKGDSAFKDIIKTAASNIDFKTYISDTSNKYGKVNEKTKTVFENNGLDYDAWFNPSPDDYVHFEYTDDNTRKLGQISSLIAEDIETLRQTPAKVVTDKNFADFIKNDRFVIPADISTNKEKLGNFVKNCLTQFDSLFRRAEKNIDNPEKRESATKALTVRNHLQQHAADIEKTDFSESGKTKKYGLTIKMWDRLPQKDIFQGNYSTCCIGMNEFNAGVMPHYLLNGAFNMIELKDDSTGEITGNALCYFVKDKTGQPLFIVDNVEIRNDSKPSEKAGIELRNAIAEYAANVAEKVTAKKDTPVYMGTHYNDVSTKDLQLTEKEVNFLGNIDCDEIYMDLYTGFVWNLSESENVKALRLK